jgi:exoribonuclease R
VQIISWNYGERFPKAFVTGVFSRAKTAESETEAILSSFEIDQREANLVVERNTIPANYLPISSHRRFEEVTFTIDPPDCLDMEDALSLSELGPDLYQVGVHISDVSSFMNLVDRKQLSERGTSFYLPHKTVQLFPKLITELCSLQPGKDRLAFSVFFKMNENGEIL